MKINREKIALDSLLCKSIVEVCEKNRISESSYYRLKKKPEFIKLIHQQKNMLFNHAINIAQASTLEAVETLRSISNDISAPASARVSAAGKILDVGQTAYDTDEILFRVEILERKGNL